MAGPLGLMHGDLTGQMGLGFGEPMRTVGDPPDHCPAALRTPAPGQGRLLAFPFRTCTSPRLLGHLLRGLADPLRPMAAIAQSRRQPLPITVVVAVITQA